LKRKKERFKIIEERANVIEPTKATFSSIKGKWHDDYFKNSNPITLELACGSGEYTVGLAKLFANRNFIGIDIKGERIWRGSTGAVENNLTNVGFLRAHILMIDSFFQRNEVSEIWITFPDPRPKKRDIKRRLTHDRYLDMYKEILQPGGYLRLKTDSTHMYDFTREIINMRNDIVDLQFTENVYESPLRDECFDIKTKYEMAFSSQGEKIKYLRFQFKK
jgi:tRNA (guanine-N7-)-methyltransferase